MGGLTDIFELFFTDKQHQDENGLMVHIHDGLQLILQERLSVPTENWDIYLSRFHGLEMNSVYGVELPSRGWGTPKLHSKVSHSGQLHSYHSSKCFSFYLSICEKISLLTFLISGT